MAEGLRVHEPALGGAARAARVAGALAAAGLDPAWRGRFPHELSGGQRQRVAIARALVLAPDVVVLDEPTSALDRSARKQVLALRRDLQDRLGLSNVFISHDLAAARVPADHVIVMREGRVVEAGPADAPFAAPRAECTRALRRSAFSRSDVLRQDAPDAA